MDTKSSSYDKDQSSNFVDVLIKNAEVAKISGTWRPQILAPNISVEIKKCKAYQNLC